MIQTIENITINGSNQIFGGYIYAVSYQSTNGQDKSRLTVNVISENGKYSVSNSSCNYLSPYNISIGNAIRFDMYLISYTQDVSPSGNILELTFIDGSHILDRIQIGLYKRHGDKTTFNLIIVGKEVDRCNPNNSPNPVDLLKNPCNPCKNDEDLQARVNYINCKENKKYEILDVRYNLGELFEAISASGLVNIDSFGDPNPKYYANYTGTIREVLSNWCNDYGYAFFWEDNKIKFLNLRSGINISATISQFCPNLAEYSSSFSIENTFKTGVITNYSRPGENESDYCDDAYWFNLPPLVQGAGNFTQPLSITTDVDEYAAGFIQYSPILRDIYTYYIKYNMKGVNNWVKGTYLKNLGLKLLDDASTFSGGTNLTVDNPTNIVAGTDLQDLINNSNISPFADNATGVPSEILSNANAIKSENGSFYNFCQLLDPSTQWRVCENPGGYFFVIAEYRQDEEYRIANEEQDYGSSFMGRYAYGIIPDDGGAIDKFFEPYTFETIQDACPEMDRVEVTGNVTFQSLGQSNGQVDYITPFAANGNPNSLSSFPFSRFLETLRNGVIAPGAANSFRLLLASRSNSFVPSPGLVENSIYEIKNADLINRLIQYLPTEVPTKNLTNGIFITEALGLQVNDDVLRNNIRVFLCPKISSNDFRLTPINSAYYPILDSGSRFDGAPLNKEVDEHNQTEIIYKYKNLRCNVLGSNSFGSINNLQCKRIILRTPVATFSYFQPHESNFGCVIEKSKKIKKDLKKIQSIYQDNLGLGNYGRFDISYRAIGDDTFQYIAQQENENGIKCHYDEEAIENLHRTYTQNLTNSNFNGDTSKRFKIYGLNITLPSITQGLDNFTISVTENGIELDVEISNKNARLPKEETINFNQYNILNSTNKAATRQYNTDLPKNYI